MNGRDPQTEESAMMIRLGCPRCGDVDLQVAEVRLELRPGAAGGATYRFGCPACGTQVAKPATPRILFVLKAHGVYAEAPDAPPDPHAPPFTMDDLLDFHVLLASTHLVAAAASAATTSAKVPHREV